MRLTEEKFLSRDGVARLCAQWRSEGLRVGFTSGAFDLLHAGHADFLERARAQCDRLVVGVNADDSVRRYKGPGRPIVDERARAQLIASLESVDLVFLFSERRNAANIELLRPDLYIKAGDYAPSNLTSAEVVERHGGKALLLEIREQTSTTDLLRRIRKADTLPSPTPAPPIAPEAISLDTPPAKQSPAVFLDRDGTINREVEYLHEPERFELLPGAGEGMRQFADMGYRIVIITTQAGIGLGYFSKEDFYRVNRAMFRALAPHGVLIDRIYFCPHGAGDGCDCRKPRTALYERACRELNLDAAASICIGDKTSDLEAARRMNMMKILVKTGHKGEDAEFSAQADFTAVDLAQAAGWILGKERAANQVKGS